MEGHGKLAASKFARGTILKAANGSADGATQAVPLAVSNIDLKDRYRT